MWGTDSKARKMIKALFPSFPVVLELDVLGTKIYTSERSHFGFSDAKLKKVLGDVDNIAALPVSRSVRSFLIGSKVIPQITFGAHCSKIPQQAFKSIQYAIAKALWVGQPMWRSKQLLQCILSKPHRTDPHFADAFNTIVEVARLCNHSCGASQQLLETWKNPIGNHCLAGTLQKAFDTLGIQADVDLRISFCGSPPVPFTGLSPKCLSKVLQNISRDACYNTIDPKSRKDFVKPTGITQAACAVLDETRAFRHCGTVFHWSISAYVAELWGVIVACATARFPATIFCDCLSVVEQADKIFAGGSPDSQWACFPWWTFLHRLTQMRETICSPPFRIKWIPAHCYEGIPIDLLNEELAALRGTTLEHILHNRLVDAAAKECATQNACVYADVQKEATRAIKSHQLWLSDLHEMLPTLQPDRAAVQEVAAPHAEISQADCEKRFPDWPWRSLKQLFRWRPKLPRHISCPRTWTGNESDWITCCNFLRGLRWQKDTDLSVSFHELAIAFHLEGFKLSRDPELTTYHDLYKLLRETILLLSHDDSVDCHPGHFHSTKPHCCGRVLPQGCIVGAAPWFDDPERVLLAKLFSLGAGRTLAS